MRWLCNTAIGPVFTELASFASMSARTRPLTATAVYVRTAPVWSGTVWPHGAQLNGVCFGC